MSRCRRAEAGRLAGFVCGALLVAALGACGYVDVSDCTVIVETTDDVDTRAEIGATQHSR